VQALALLSIVPLIGIIFMGVILNRETWIAGNAWKDSND
jgi:hypothetical protein